MATKITSELSTNSLVPSLIPAVSKQHIERSESLPRDYKDTEHMHGLRSIGGGGGHTVYAKFNYTFLKFEDAC